jgi:hypothetical protein
MPKPIYEPTKYIQTESRMYPIGRAEHSMNSVAQMNNPMQGPLAMISASSFIGSEEKKG